MANFLAFGRWATGPFCEVTSFTGLLAGVLPSEGIDQVIHILFEELIDHTQRVFIWCRIEIEGAAQEMMGRMVTKNCLAVAALPPTVKKTPPTPLRVTKGESSMALAL